MADLLFLAPRGSSSLPALGLLSHTLTHRPLDPASLGGELSFDAIVVDATGEMAAARATCLALREARRRPPVLLVVTEGGLPAVTREWDAADIVLAGAGPAEVDARLRLLAPPPRAETVVGEEAMRAGELILDPVSYSARLHGDPLDLTFKEFELLKFLMANPGQVFSRAQLLSEVWGYDYFGGTRTVDVHVRRLRAKLGMDHEALIGTVRNVGYRFDAPKGRAPNPAA